LIDKDSSVKVKCRTRQSYCIRTM